MCISATTLALLSAASTVGSVLMNQSAARAQQRARNEALSAEAMRQQQYQQEADAQMQAAMPKFTAESEAKNFQQSTKQREDTVSNLPSEVGTGDYQGTAMAPSEYRTELGKLFQKEVEKGKAQAKNYSALSAYGDVAQDRGVELNRTGQGQSMLSRFSRGSSEILPLELALANQAGSNKMLFGDILSGLGSIGSAYAMAGLFDPWRKIVDDEARRHESRRSLFESLRNPQL